MNSASFESNLATKSDEAQNLLFFTFLEHFWRITKENIVIIRTEYLAGMYATCLLYLIPNIFIESREKKRKTTNPRKGARSGKPLYIPYQTVPTKNDRCRVYSVYTAIHLY